MNIEEDARDVRLAQLAILQESIQDKNERIWELAKKVEILEGMLNQLASRQGGWPIPQPLPAHRLAPRRWSVK